MFEVYLEYNGRNPGADEWSLAALLSEFGLEPPADYVQLMLESDGFEGFVGEYGYAQLWSVRDMPSRNRGYLVQEFVPGVWLIGSNGGAVAFGLDTSSSPNTVIALPFIGMSASTIVARNETFEGFLASLAEGFRG